MSYRKLAILCLLSLCNAFSHGAPDDACYDMYPTGHNAEPQTTESPYIVEFEADEVVPGQYYNISIYTRDEDGPEFEGFVLQVHNSNGNITGAFSELPCCPIKYMDCDGGDSVTHGKRLGVFEYTMMWSANETELGGTTYVYAVATIIQEQKMYWMDVMSEDIPITTSDGTPVDDDQEDQVGQEEEGVTETGADQGGEEGDDNTAEGGEEGEGDAEAVIASGATSFVYMICGTVLSTFTSIIVQL